MQVSETLLWRLIFLPVTGAWQISGGHWFFICRCCFYPTAKFVKIYERYPPLLSTGRWPTPVLTLHCYFSRIAVVGICTPTTKLSSSISLFSVVYLVTSSPKICTTKLVNIFQDLHRKLKQCPMVDGDCSEDRFGQNATTSNRDMLAEPQSEPANSFVFEVLQIDRF